jgi:hypothetical protein
MSIPSIFKSILAFLILVPSLCLADIHRVNNSGVGGTPDFISLQSAINDAGVAAGDTLLLEHSNTPYDGGGITLNKSLTIYGTGYFLGENDQTQADTRTSSIDQLSITTGASGCIIAGIEIGTLVINEDNVFVIRCNMTGTVVVGNSGNVANLYFGQCYIETSAADALMELDDASNFVITNCFFHNTNSGGTNNVRVDNGNGVVLNNIFRGEPDNIFKNSFVQSNYFKSSEIDAVNSSNLTVTHNMTPDTFLDDEWGGAADFNLFGSLDYEPDTLFCFSLLDGVSTAARYQLNSFFPANPAVGAGADGGDIGMFGGAKNYVLSGMPPIPSVTGYSGGVSGTSSGGGSATVSGKSRR